MRILSSDSAINSGIYRFDFAKDGTSAKARYTYLYRKVAGKWKIMYHHSSLMPQTIEDEVRSHSCSRNEHIHVLHT